MSVRSRMRAILEGDVITGPFKHKLGLEMGPPKSEKQRRQELPEHPVEGDVVIHRDIRKVRKDGGEIVPAIQWVTSRIVGNLSTDKNPDGTHPTMLDSHDSRKKAKERALHAAKSIAGRAWMKTNDGHERLDAEDEE